MSNYYYGTSTGSANIKWEEDDNNEYEYILVKVKRKPFIFKDKFYKTYDKCIMEELAKSGHTGAIWVVCQCPRCTPRC